MNKLILILLTSCVGNTEADTGAVVDPRRQRGDDIAADIMYIRDSATKLCFAYGWRTYGYAESAVGGLMLANVPCDAVRAYLMNPEITAEKP